MTRIESLVVILFGFLLLSGCEKDENINQSWIKYYEIPIESSSFDILTSDDKTYILSENNNLWQLNIREKKLIDKMPLPMNRLYILRSVCSTIDGFYAIIAEGDDSLDVWNYNIEKDAWYKKNSLKIEKFEYPYSEYFEINSFSKGGELFLNIRLIQFTTEIDFENWKLDINTNQWTKESCIDLGRNSTIIEFHNSIFRCFGDNGHPIGMDRWIETSNDLFEFIPETNSWEQKKSCPGESRRGAVAFEYDNNLFFGLGEFHVETFTTITDKHFVNDFWQYDIINDEWIYAGEFKDANTKKSKSFSIDNEVYITINKDVWKFNGW